jgi:environmental stress-induced protein Ves
MLSIAADSITPQAWRNGGGRTRELLTRPVGPDWAVRVSLADIDADGPFSAFPGVQRWFVVVQGAGVLLGFADGERRVRAGVAPLCFDGALAPGCRLIDGPTRDLNLMVRAGVGAMLAVQAGEPWRERFDQRGLFTLTAGRWCAEAVGGGGVADVSDAADGTGAIAARGSPPERREQRVPAHTLLWDLGDAPCRFIPDHDTPCGWWLGVSGPAS